MVQVTNTAAQTVAPNQEVLFNDRVGNCGCCGCNAEYWRNGTGAVWLKYPGTYEISFSANIGATTVSPTALAIQVGGQTLPETVMEVTTAAAGDLNNVATTTYFEFCGWGGGNVSVVNVGTADATDITANVQAPNLTVRRVR